MDFCQMENLECQIALEKYNNDAMVALSNFDLFLSETRYMPESTVSAVYEGKVYDIAAKIVYAIENAIKAIAEFAGKLKDKVLAEFGSKETKEKLDAAKETVSKNKEVSKKQVDMYIDEENRKLLDDYIQSMAKLERQLMNIKVGAMVGKPGTKNNLHVIEANEIIHKMDELNHKYDSEFLQKNDKIIKMAAEDAIRFNEKQLNNIKVDYAAVEKGCKEILNTFKKDAKGCDVPIKLNIIQRMSNAIGTRVRKFLHNHTKFMHSNLKSILTGVAIGIAVKKGGDAVVKNVKASPEAMKHVSDIAKKATDKLPKNVAQHVGPIVQAAVGADKA